MADLTVKQFIESVRDGKYAHGGYPKFWLTHDGETFSYETVRKEIWRIARAIRDQTTDGWRVVAYDVNWEDPEMYDGDSGERIPSAYAEHIDESVLNIARCGAFTHHLVPAEMDPPKALCGEENVFVRNIPLTDWGKEIADEETEWCVKCTAKMIAWDPEKD